VRIVLVCIATHDGDLRIAARYHIPLGTLRDWEQGRAEPDQAARAYLTGIARAPDVVRKALRAKR